MIESLYIQNFLSYREGQEISFVASNKEKGQNPEMSSKWSVPYSDNKRLLKLLIFIGENGAGKTNAIEAVSYLREIAIASRKDRSDLPPYDPYLMDNESSKLPTVIKMTYYIEDESYTYSVEVCETCVLSEELKRNAGRASSKVFVRKTDVETGSVSISFGSASDLSKQSQRDLQSQTIAPSSVLSTFWASNMESSVLSRTYDYFKNRISLVHPSRKETLADKLHFYRDDNRMQELVRKLLRDLTTNIVDYEVGESVFSLLDDEAVQNNPLLRDAMLKQYPDGRITHRFLQFVHETDRGRFKIDSDAESSGTISLVRLMIVMYDIILAKKSSFIDEIGRDIHTKALEYIIKAFLLLSDDCQLVVTTHDLRLLDMDFMRRDSVRRVFKNELGESIVKMIDQNQLHRNSSLMNFEYGSTLTSMPDLLVREDLLAEYQEIFNR